MKTEIIRQIVLDTETTGMNKIGIPYEGHNIIEIGAVEMINRCITNRNFHVYIKPPRLIDPEAFKIHGISDDFLQNKPSFIEIADKFLDFIRGAELVIHNAPFDIGFIDYEFSKLDMGIKSITNFCQIVDSLVLARKLFPGKRNNLNALCNRYHIDSSERILHSALTDAKILAKVYIAMTGGQISLAFLSNSELNNKIDVCKIRRIKRDAIKLNIVYANLEEIVAHEEQLNLIEKKNGKISIWKSINSKKE